MSTPAAPGNSPGCITINGNDNQSSSGDLNIEIGGASPGTGCDASTQFDRLVVNGTVSLGVPLGGDLNLSLIDGFIPALGNVLKIIDNDGTDAVSETFNALAEGAVVFAGGGAFVITYAGGSGNNVLRTALPPGCTSLVTNTLDSGVASLRQAITDANAGVNLDTIGGTAAGAGNIIASNAGAGIALDADAAASNTVRRNSIFSNGGLGIDIDSDGVTFNDFGDADGIDNFPVISVEVADDDQPLEPISITQAITVLNETPSALSLELDEAVIDENGSVFLSPSFFDPGFRDSHQVVIDWGDGSDDNVLDLRAGATSFAFLFHRYLDDPAGPGDGDFTITVTAADTDEPGVPTSATIDVTVANLAPSVDGFDLLENGALSDGVIDEGQAVEIEGVYFDVSTDRPTVQVDWGDGTIAPASVTWNAGTGSYTAKHTYRRPLSASRLISKKP